MSDHHFIARPYEVKGFLIESMMRGTGKSQFRRVLSPQPAGHVSSHGWSQDHGPHWIDDAGRWPLPFGAGDRLYVREHVRRSPHIWRYWADDRDVPWPQRRALASCPRDDLSGSQMPRAASRITLYVEDFRVERLHDITDADAHAEGVQKFGRFYAMDADDDWDDAAPSARAAFAQAWDRDSRVGSWQANPYVVVYTVWPVLMNIDAAPARLGEAA